MLKGTTKSGFKFEIEDKRLNNYELLEAISEVEESPLALPRVIKLLLGDSKAKAWLAEDAKAALGDAGVWSAK